MRATIVRDRIMGWANTSTSEHSSIQISEINNVSNVIIIQKANTKSSLGQQGLPTNAKVGSGAMEEYASSAEQSYPP
jgi:hypothetical protein